MSVLIGMWSYKYSSSSSDEKCASELNGWNLMFDDKLVQYDARVLPAEQISQKDSKVRKVPGM